MSLTSKIISPFIALLVHYWAITITVEVIIGKNNSMNKSPHSSLCINNYNKDSELDAARYIFPWNLIVHSFEISSFFYTWNDAGMDFVAHILLFESHGD